MRMPPSLSALVLLLLCALPGNGQKKPSGIPAKSEPPPAPVNAKVEFLRDIAPILDRNACSTAGCHGKFGGRGGLQISLLTLSPEDDYEPLVYGGRGRRINFAAPEKSLLLLKATMAVPHVGGPRFAVGSPDYNTMLRWIKQGAPFSDSEPRLVTLTISPEKAMIPKVGQTQQLRATATYTDGSSRDVTRQCVYESTNTAVISVNASGLVTGQRWGGGSIIARYLGTVTAAFLTLPQERTGAYPEMPVNNVIDKLVFENLKRLNVLPSKPSSDVEFLRRVTLDTLGRLPTPQEIPAFVNDTSPGKRAKLIDTLLEKPEFADLRALRLSDLLRVNPRKIGNNSLADRSAALFYEWIWKSVAQNKPWDAFVRELITARGSTYQNGPANFFRIERGPNDRMENIGQAFLGVRMSCARCHKHPFDRWNTDNYWNFAAFMSKVQLAGGRLNDENNVFYNPGAQIVNQSVNGRNRGKIAPATFLGDKEPAPASDDMIIALANWMTSPKNPFFARATVNRLWSHYFGRGIIHPVDDMRNTSPESVPGLLDALAKELVENQFDTKHVIRLILNSKTYQLSSLPNESNMKDDRFFSHGFPRAMPAQVLLDMMNQVTGAKEDFGAFPERNRAVQSALPIGNYFLYSFGQSHREFLADIDPKLEPNLVQTLLMINSPYVEGKIRGGTGVAQAMSGSDATEDLIKNMYMKTFCRPPTEEETKKAAQIMTTAATKREGAQDLMWALITAREFYFNH